MSTFDGFELLHTYNENHLLIKCKVRDLFNKNVVNWKYNRPPDLVRCGEIAKTIYTKHPELDWLLYMITIENAPNILHFIDGIHRYTALHIIQTECGKPIDFITPSIFTNNTDWLCKLYDKTVVISLRMNATTGEAIDLFQSLNKCNPVPELYMINSNYDKRNIIENVVKEWTTRYKTHFTATQKPNVPNINRDRFIDFLDTAYEKYKITNNTSYLLLEKIDEMNNYVKTHIPIKTPVKALEKCNETGCFLFLIKREILEDHIISLFTTA
jgi:hypothetical protein